MPGEHVFLTYISEDSHAIDELQSALEAADFIVWRDKDKLWPGDDWQDEIRKAIRSGSFVFLACFSSNLAKREKSYQFEELTVAAEEYRLRPPNASWLMTARLDECEIPEVNLGAGRTLGRTIHRADLFGAVKSSQLTRLIVSIQRSTSSSPPPPPASVSAATAEAGRAESDVVENVRNLLRNPSLVMDYDEYLSALSAPLREALGNRERFPLSLPAGATHFTAEIARSWVKRVREYDDVLAPALVPLKLISMYGTQVHEQELTQTLRALAQESNQESGTDVLTSVHEYPALLATYAATLGAVAKRNYSMLRAVTVDVEVRTIRGQQRPFILTSGAQSVVGISEWLALGTILCLEDEEKAPDDAEIDALLSQRGGRRHTPISDHLFTVLAPLFRPQFASDADFADAFDRTEVLLDAISEDARLWSLTQPEQYYGAHGGYGRYTWRHRHSEKGPESVMLEEARAQGAGWTPLLGGLFGGSSERAIAALETVQEYANHSRLSLR